MPSEHPALQRFLLRGVRPVTVAIGGVGVAVVGIGLALTIGAAVGLLGIAAVAFGFAVLYCVGVTVEEVNRGNLRREALHFHGPAVDADAVKDFFVTPASGRFARSSDDGLPPNVRRSRADDIVAGLKGERFVIVVGKRESGISRLIFEIARESGHNVLVSKRMGVPSEDPLTMLMRDPDGFDSDEAQILYLRDFTSRMVSGLITPEFLRDWLAQHPGVSVLVTLNPVDRERIKANGSEAEDEFERLEGLASVVSLAPTLIGEELVEAREQYPELEELEREWLPSYLVSADPLRARFRDGDGEHGNAAGIKREGRAVVRAVADWQRAGSGWPAPEEYVRRVAARYLDGTEPRDFEAALAWAATPVVGHSASLLYPIQGEDDEVGFEVDDVILTLLDDPQGGPEATPLPDFVWDAVIEELIADAARRPGAPGGAADRRLAEAFIGVGQSARVRGRTKIAGRILRKAARLGNDHQHQRIVQILSAEVDFSSAPQSLVNSRRGDGVIRRLHAVEDLVQARKGRSRQPASGNSAGPTAFFAWIYRRRAMRTLVRLFVLCLFDAASAAFGLAIGLVLRGFIAGDLDSGAAAAIFGKSVALWSAMAIFAFALVRLYKQDARRAQLGGIVLAMAAMSGIGFVASLADGFSLIASFVAAFWGGLMAAWGDYRLRVKYDEISRAWVMDHGLHASTLAIGTASQAKMVERVAPKLARPTVIVGYLSTGGPRIDSCLGTVEDLAKVALDERIGRVLIADPGMSAERRQQLANRCHLLGLLVEAIATLPDIRAGSGEPVAGQSLVLVPLKPIWQSDPGFYAKRALDIVLALAGIALLWPLLLAFSAISWVKSGKIVTRSWRPGLGGSVFGMYRFPSTSKDAISPGDPSDPDGDPGRSATGFGAWMRRRGLDELPQLFNVLIGQMSFVGPRPLRVADHSKLEGEQLLRYVVRPGVISSWQLCDPPVLTHAELVRLDMAYLRHWSVLRDLELLVKTARVMLRGRKTLPRLVDESDVGTEEIEPPVTHMTKESWRPAWWRSRRR